MSSPSPRSTQLDLAIEALAADRYRLTANGVLTAEIAAPFTLAELSAVGEAIDGRVDLSKADRAKAAADFGDKLFAAVFTGAIGDAYTKNPPSHLRIDVERAGLLADIPWKLLRVPNNGAPTIEVIGLPAVPRSVGGVGEMLSGPRLLLSPAALLVLIALVVIAGTVIQGLTPKNVDLTIISLRTVPPQPSPGELVNVAITIKNTGTDKSDSFQWAWFLTDPRSQAIPKPDLVETVTSIPAGAQLTVRGEFIFGLWGKYDTVGWVNYNNKLQELNFNNNLSSTTTGHVTISGNTGDSFVVDFSRLPDNTLLSTVRELKSEEFSQWGITIKPDATGDDDCAKAIVRLLPEAAGNDQLMTSLPGNANVCNTLPVVFTTSSAIGGASVDLQADRAGDYTLQLTDANGQLLGSTKVTVAQAGAQTLHIPTDATFLATAKNATRIVYSGPSGSITAIQKLTLFKAAPSS